MEKKLRKSNNKLLAGVCAGMAEYMDVDPTVVRVVFTLVSLFIAGFPGLIIYLILCLIMPSAEVR